MSTVANTRVNNPEEIGAKVFIGLMVAGAAAMVVNGCLHVDSWHLWEFLGLLLVSTLTARLKVKLPALSSNMSVSLPFLLIAMTRLSLPETLCTAAVSVFTQSVPKSPHKFNPVHALFNVSTGVLATGLGWQAFHHAARVRVNSTASLLLGCVAYLIASTFPVAEIIALTDRQGTCRTWLEIVQLSFPYYVASAGLASIALSFQGESTWSLLVGMGSVAFVMYQSFRRYFANQNVGTPTPASAQMRAKSASAAA